MFAPGLIPHTTPVNNMAFIKTLQAYTKEDVGVGNVTLLEIPPSFVVLVGIINQPTKERTT